MTNDYKEKLLKYLTGNIESETGSNEPQFIDKGLINENIFDYLTSAFSEYTGWTYYGELNIPNSEFTIIYGNYYNTDLSNANGYLYVLKNMEPAYLVTEYDTGTKFKAFVGLSVDEEGYIYGIDSEDLSPQAPNPKFRFIMLNKIFSSFASGYNKVKLRQSYYLPTSLNSNKFWFDLGNSNLICNKQIGNANYYFLAELWDMSFTTSQGLGVIGLTINVGSSNDWNLASISGYLQFVSVFPKYSNGNFSLILGLKQSYQTGTYNEALYTTGDTPSITLQNTFTIQDYGYVGAVEKMGVDKTYIFGLYPDNGTITVNIYLANYTASVLEKIYTFSTDYDYVENVIKMVNINGNLFFEYFWKYTENSTDMMSSYIGMIIDRDVYYINGATWEYEAVQSSPHLYVTNVYNLYALYAPTDANTTKKIQLIYNVNNYNGQPYESENCLVPNSGILRDGNDNIIFARNLYNKTILGAVTTSTLQIPNTMLNDVTISENDLISTTNLSLTEDATDITKNIYETVNINFANSISIKNDNDVDNEILNPVASARLNGSTTQAVDYEDAYAGKLRINYSNGTNMIIELNPSVNITYLTDTSAQYDFTIYVSKAIDTLEIISMDEITSYQTISNLNLEVGKIYQITQEVEVQ